MLKNIRRLVHILIGSLIVFIGILGLFLPILNGTILLIIGFIIISFEVPVVEKKLFQLTKKNATVHVWHMSLEKTLRKLFRKH